jgi:ABC-type lipoprotein release transport system permease subunit
MKRTKGQKRSRRGVAKAADPELVFVVDVSSFTKEGFVGSTRYEGKQVDLEFDADGRGISLSPEMAGRLGVRRGSSVSVAIENDANMVVKATVASVGRSLLISDAKIYYAVGREGGAVLRLRKE